MKKKIITTILIAFLLTASCQTTHFAAPVEHASPTLTPSPMAATMTKQPSSTATISPPTVTVDVQATQTQKVDDLLQAEMDAFPVPCVNFYQRILSPTKSWLAIQCGSTVNQSLEILSKSGQRLIFQFSDYIPDEFTHDGNVFLGGLIPLYWSENEQFLYFVSYIHMDGGGTCFYGMGYHGLFRIDITNGDVSTILPLTSNANFYSLSISPDGKWLAYGIDKPSLLNLETGEKIGINIKGNFGNLTWAPDSSKLAFATCQTANNEDKVDESEINYFEMDSRDLHTIIEEKNRFFVIYTSDDHKMEILSQDSVNFEDITHYYYDWSSQTLTQLTPTTTQ